MEVETRFIKCFQLRVIGSDGGDPPRSATAIIKVQVTRNFEEPRFSPAEYSKTILETQPIGVSIVKVTARDRDVKVHII